AGRFAGSRQRGSRRGIGVLAVLLACLAFAACQGPEGERRMHQFVGVQGKDEEAPVAPGSPTASPGAPKQLTQGQAIQPPSDTANVPTLKNAEIYRGEGAAPPPSTPQQNPVTVSGTGEVTLNFVNADIREVIDTVLGNTLKVGFVIDPRVQGVVTLRTAR